MKNKSYKIVNILFLLAVVAYHFCMFSYAGGTVKGLSSKLNMIIIVSDNGGDLDDGANNDLLRGENGAVWDGGIRVPVMVSWPSMILPGSVCDSRVDTNGFF